MGAGGYVEAVEPDAEEAEEEVAALIRNQVAFQILFARQLRVFREALEGAVLRATLHGDDEA